MAKKAAKVLAEKLGSGQTLELARNSTIIEMGLELGKSLARQSLEDSLESFGLGRALAPKILALASTKDLIRIAGAFMVVVSGGGASGMPTASCLSRHLPPDHEPSEEEIEAAIEACRREMEQKA
jgi:hypothetical protein